MNPIQFVEKWKDVELSERSAYQQHFLDPRAYLFLGQVHLLGQAVVLADHFPLGLRERKGAELIACPTCGRIQVDLFTLVQDVRAKLAEQIELPIKVAVMGCVVNGPGEAEGADVAVFAGDRRGIIYVQGERVANVPEGEILDRLLDECLKFQEKVKRGEAQLGQKKVEIVPPDPIGGLGSGWEKMAAERMRVTPTIGRT